MIVNQLVPASTIVAATLPTTTPVIVPKSPFVNVTQFPPANGPAFVDAE